MNIESFKTAEKVLDEKLSRNYKIEKEQLKKPVIKIIGIENTFNLTKEDIEEDINNRNFADLLSKGSIIHIFTKNQKTTVLMEVSPEIHKHIRENKDRIFVGYQNCKVFDVINVIPCFKCGRFGHSGTKCRNDPNCLKCAGPHLSRNCDGTKPTCCANCSYSNKTFGTKYNCEHVTMDSEMCVILKNKIKKVMDTTDYTIKPLFPRFLGKIDTLKIVEPNGSK